MRIVKDYESLERRLKHLGEKYLKDLKFIYESVKRVGIPNDEQVMDIGTGIGKMAIILVMMGYHVITGEPRDVNWGDWETPAFRTGTQKYIRFRPFRAEEIPYLGGVLPGVFMLATFHHVDDPVKALKECHRIVKKNGKIVIFDYPPSEIEKLKEKYPGHPDAIDPRDYLDVLGDSAKLSFYEETDSLYVCVIEKLKDL